jgi:hypothetical protein
MSEKITIEATNESISEAIKAGVTSPELVDGWLGTAAELVEDAVVINLTTWGARDLGGGKIEVECDTAQEAAQEFVDGGEWGENKETFWVDVRVWRNGVNADGEIVAVDEETITIEVDPNQAPALLHHVQRVGHRLPVLHAHQRSILARHS